MMYFAMCTEQRRSRKTGIFRGCGFFMKLLQFSTQLVWLCEFLLFLYSSRLPMGNFRARFCTHENTVSHRSSAEMSCRGEVGVSFVALGILKRQTARHWFRSAVISRRFSNVVGRQLLKRSAQVHLLAPSRRGMATQLKFSLKLMAPGQYGLLIEEVDDFKKRRRAQKSVVVIKKLKQPKICTIKTVECAYSTCCQLEDSTSSSKFSSVLVDPVNLYLRLTPFFRACNIFT
jgi:hypothetical protein